MSIFVVIDAGDGQRMGAHRLLEEAIAQVQKLARAGGVSGRYDWHELAHVDDRGCTRFYIHANLAVQGAVMTARAGTPRDCFKAVRRLPGLGAGIGAHQVNALLVRAGYAPMPLQEPHYVVSAPVYK